MDFLQFFAVYSSAAGYTVTIYTPFYIKTILLEHVPQNLGWRTIEKQ